MIPSTRPLDPKGLINVNIKEFSEKRRSLNKSMGDLAPLTADDLDDCDHLVDKRVSSKIMANIMNDALAKKKRGGLYSS